jgi:hypothetical protein
MTADSTTGFVRQISAVSPLNGDALDGSARPKPGRARAERRERLDASRTFFCSNPQCDHATWAAAEQATHMAAEFWEVAQELVRLAPDSLLALKLTGGVILSELTDEECRQAATDRRFLQQQQLPIPLPVRLGANEYHRRCKHGQLDLLTDTSQRAPRRIILSPTCGKGHEFTPDNTYVDPSGGRQCRTCRRDRQRDRYSEAPYRERKNEAGRDRYHQLDPESRARRLEQQRVRKQQRYQDDPEFRARLLERKRQAKLRKKLQTAAEQTTNQEGTSS